MARRPGHARPPLEPRAQAKPAQLRDRALTLSVQLFGRKDSRDTQKALRYFKERRVPVSFVDIAQRPPAPTELRRFAQRFGAANLIDPNSRAYAEQGLSYMRLGDEEAFERLLAQPALLRLPLARAGHRLAVGADEAAWQEWVKNAD